MLSCWSPATHALAPTSDLEGHAWVHAAAPTPEECRRLTTELGVPPDFLQHALDLDEVARLDHEGDVALVMLRVPWVGATAELPFRTASLALVLLDRRVITISPAEGLTMTRVGLPANLSPEHPVRFMLQLFTRVAERFLADVRDIDRRVDEVEVRLSTSLRNSEVLELLRYQKGLAHFETGLASNLVLLERLRRDERLAKSPVELELLDDLAVELRQATEMANISTSVLAQLMGAYASIISNNLNGVMRLLTALTLLVAIPTAVSSFFGMNVTLPFASHPLAFELAVVVSLGLVLGVGVLFRRWRWL